MTTELKKQIAKAAKAWVDSNPNHSNSLLATRADVNTSYMSHILREKFEIENAGRQASPISDAIFYKIADAIGLKLEFRPHFNCENYLKVTQICAFAQANHRRYLLDGKDSGLSKTYTLEKYAREHEGVLYVKCTSLMRGKDLIQLLLEKLGINLEGRHTMTSKLAHITSKMITPGYLIILDEFENVASDMYRVLKDVEDATYQKCGLIVCGMGITRDLEQAAKRQAKLGPQIWRRFKTNRLMLGMYKAEYTRVGAVEYGITDPNAIGWLQERVTDYAMLAEYVTDIHNHLIAAGHPVTKDTLAELFKPL